MIEKKYNKLGDMKTYFENINDRKKTIEYLGEKSNTFWNYINLLVYTQKILKDCNDIIYPKFAMDMLLYDFINHIVISYDLVLQNMQRECFIMLRQSYEVFWLLKYFDKKPIKEEEWIKSAYQNEFKDSKIRPSDVRNAFPDERKNMGMQYNNMSDYVHSNFNSYAGISLGGFYDEKFIDFGMMKLIVTLADMLEFLYKLFEKKPASYLSLDHEDFYVINKNAKINNTVREKLNYSINTYRDLVKEMPNFLITRDYEQEALEELISMGILKINDHK
jgi:hypothetical protein